MKQTALEWLVCEIGGLDTGVSYHYFAKKVEEAKEMEKQQIIDACHEGVDYENSIYENAEDYYSKTYGGEK